MISALLGLGKQQLGFLGVVQALGELVDVEHHRAQHGTVVLWVCAGYSRNSYATSRSDVAPAQYLQNLRVNGARRLIARGASLAEAAHTMGFADHAHMQRAFKVRHAMTPGSYAPPRSTPG